MKKPLKFLHELGTVGVMGVVLVQFVLAANGAAADDVEHASIRAVMDELNRWLLLPSLLLVMASGALALAFHKPFHNADWAITKALMTPLILEGTFMAVSGPAKRAARLSAKLADGDEDVRAALESTLTHERWGLGVMTVLFTANVVLSVWRPRLRRKFRPSTPSAAGSTS